MSAAITAETYRVERFAAAVFSSGVSGPDLLRAIRSPKTNSAEIKTAAKNDRLFLQNGKLNCSKLTHHSFC